MALLPTEKVIDTIIAWLEAERPIFDTIINAAHPGRRLTIFHGSRSQIPANQVPAIEVAALEETLGWFACRVQQESPSLRIDVTVDNQEPEPAARLLSSLASLTTRILAHPAHLLPQIEGTQTHLFDSLPDKTRYDTAQNGRQRVATILWQGRYIEYLANRLFRPELRMLGAVDFPPN